jgi:PBP1b-binding outer membrane lipoprotein LpoB
MAFKINELSNYVAEYAGRNLRDDLIPISADSFNQQIIKEINKTYGEYNFNQPTKTKEHNMEMKKYVFTISYEEKVNSKTETKYGTLSLWAHNLIHANDLFKKLYNSDCRGDYATPTLNVTSVFEQPDLV